jgi:uncharacterized membrane protein YeiH
MNPWFEAFAVAISAISGVLAARGQRLDLFGILVLALVTAVGGGTIRDLCLGVRPVFWVQDPTHLVTAGVAALAMFVLARFWEPPAVTLQVADAFGLALFTIVGVEKSLLFQASPVTAVVLGVVTGVAGGLLRDVLRREVPLVFQTETYFYATAAFAGAVLFVLLTRWVPDVPGARAVSMAVILLLRLAALGWKWKLPVFTSRQS